MDALPLLTLLLFTLPVGVILIGLLPKPAWAKGIALAAVSAGLAIAGLVVSRFDVARAGFQLVDKAVWEPGLPLRYLVGVDGLSLLFLPTTLLLFLAVIVTSWTREPARPRAFYALLLLLGATTLGLFLALDGILFLFFWLLSLLPLYFLLSGWGDGGHHRRVAVRYSLIMLAGGMALLAGFLLLAFNHAQMGGGLAFDLPRLLRTPLPDRTEYLVFCLLLLGFSVKLPVFPLHAWLPMLAIQGPVAVAAVLLGLKLGVYGLIRFAIPLAPDAARDLHWLLAGLGVVGILYGAVAAFAQTSLRALLAYFSLAQAGLVLLGIAAFTQQGIQGAVLQLLNFNLAVGALFLLVGLLQARVGSTDIAALGGAARSMPLLSGFFLFFGLASLGLPLTAGFPAELLILVTALQTHGGAGLAALFGMVLGAACFLSRYRRAFLGSPTRPSVTNAGDLRLAEVGMMVLFAAILIAVGLYPATVLEIIQKSGALWVSRVAGSP